jgi:hypothetical protein
MSDSQRIAQLETALAHSEVLMKLTQELAAAKLEASDAKLEAAAALAAAKLEAAAALAAA